MNLSLQRPPSRFALLNGVSTLPVGAATAASVLLNNDRPNIPDLIAAQAKALKLAVSELLWSLFRNTNARCTHVHGHPLGFEKVETIVTFSYPALGISQLVPEMHQKEIS